MSKLTTDSRPGSYRQNVDREDIRQDKQNTIVIFWLLS
jgi:hypothetical protein